MKNIIVPTDFSDNAANALVYACELNKKLNADILLLHSYFIPAMAGEAVVMPVSDVEIKKIAMDGLNKTKTSFEQKYPGMQFSVQLTLGVADVEIVDYEKKMKADLIVMGTKGASGLTEFLLGTNTARVIEKAGCPVLTVPDNASFNGLKTIVFAADYGDHNFSHIHKVIDIGKLFDSEIILLHISRGEGSDVFEDLQIGRFKERIIQESAYEKITYRLYEDKDVFHGMNYYVEQFKPDMLAISMKSRTLIEKIFSRSLTKRMAYHSQVPVLALHI